MRCIRSLFQVLMMLFAVTAAASAAEITILALDSKTGEPLPGKKFCLTFSTDVRQGPPRQCDRTDKHGLVTLQLPTPTPANVWSAPETNDLMPCYRTSQGVPLTVIETSGYAVTNTCGVERIEPSLRAGVLVLFAHQMSFWEALKHD